MECGPAGHWQSGSHSGRLPDELLVSTVWTSTLQKRDCISSWVGAGGYCGTVSVHFGTLCTAPLLQLSAFCTFHFALITSTNLWVAGDRTIWTIWTTSKWFLGQWCGRLSTICWDRKWYKRLHKQTTTSYYMQSNKGWGVKEEPKQSLVYQSNICNMSIGGMLWNDEMLLIKLRSYWYVMIWRGLPLKAWLRCWPLDDPITEYIMQPDLPSSSPPQCTVVRWLHLIALQYMHYTTFHDATFTAIMYAVCTTFHMHYISWHCIIWATFHCNIHCGQPACTLMVSLNREWPEVCS